MQSTIITSPNGPNLSRIVFGAMRTGIWGHAMSTPELEKLVAECLEIGVTTFDHADIYGHYTTEEDFGKILKINASWREQMQIITKCGINLVTPNRPNIRIKSYDTSRAHILKSVDQSLQNLATDYIDVLLIHRPSPLIDADEIAEAFALLKNAGKVRHFGVSNFTPAQFDLLQDRVELVTNQVEISATHLEPFLDGTLDQAQQYRCAPMAWSPLGGGQFFKAPRSERVQRICKALLPLEEKYNAATDQLLLAFLLKHPARILPVLGTGRIDRIKAAVAALDIALTREEWFMIWSASTGEEVA